MKNENEKTKMSMKVKVLNTFSNPLNGRMLAIGEVLSVPKQRFWHRRIKEKDVEIFEEKKAVISKKETKKGSK